MIWVEFALTGLFAGFMAGYLGIGGGIILVPVLSWIFSRDPATAGIAVQMAVATSLATMLFSSLSSVIAQQRKGAILWPIAKRLLPGLMLGALLGALVADSVSSEVLGRVFGIFLLIIGVQMLRGARKQANHPLPGAIITAAVGAGIGSISSLFGVGGGSMTVPWLLRHGQQVRNSVATAAACGYPIAVAGTIAFIFLGVQTVDTSTAGASATVISTLGYINLQALAGIAVFSVMGAPLGVAAVHRSKPELAKRVFAVFLLIGAARMLLA